MVGPVASSLTTAVFLVLLMSWRSWTSHGTRRPAVSALIVWGRQLSAGTGWGLPRGKQPRRRGEGPEPLECGDRRCMVGVPPVLARPAAPSGGRGPPAACGDGSRARRRRLPRRGLRGRAPAGDRESRRRARYKLCGLLLDRRGPPL